MFRDGVGIFLGWELFFLGGKGRIFLRESVMKTNKFSFSLHLSLSPFTFSKEPRHCFASSFLSCGHFFFTLSLSPISSHIKRKELLLPCCCTPYPKIKRLRDVLISHLAVLSLVSSLDQCTHFFSLLLLEFFSNNEGISFVSPRISSVSLVVFFPLEPFVFPCRFVVLLFAHSFVHLPLGWLFSGPIHQFLLKPLK